MQEVDQDQLETTVTNYLFRIQEDPNEYNNLAQAHPEVVQAGPAPGMPPNKQIERILDMQHGERGRLVYDCAPKWWLGGMCLSND